MSTAAIVLPTRTDVLIVGAGPTGLALGCALAARGMEPLVLDRAAQGGNTSRAAVLHARTLEVLENLDVTQQLLQLGEVVPRFTIRDRDRPLLEIAFDDLPTTYPYTLMLPLPLVPCRGRRCGSRPEGVACRAAVRGRRTRRRCGGPPGGGPIAAMVMTGR